MALFDVSPESAAGTSLVGIARLAAESPLLAGKRQVEYFSLPAKSILNRCSSRRVPFVWTINPYRGCEFGCKYCYARYTHEYMGMDSPELFEEKIYSKARASEILRAELGRNPRGAICIGTATDPYQPAERRFFTTRAILETIAEFRGHQLFITTKSDLIQRDMDLLTHIAKHNSLEVNITVTTLREELARCLEVRAPRPDLRLGAVAALARAGITVGVLAMPVIPGITDDPSGLDDVARAAAEAGASHFAVNALFLMPSAQKAFFPFLAQSFPDLVERYREAYARGAYIESAYRKRLQAVARQIQRKYGLEGSRRPYAPQGLATEPQLRLFQE